MHEKFGLLSPGKASSHSKALPSFSSCVQCFHVSILPAVTPTLLLRQMDMGSLTCAEEKCAKFASVPPYTRRKVRHKQGCIRVDSEGQKNCFSSCPARGSNLGFSDLNSDSLTTELRTARNESQSIFT